MDLINPFVVTPAALVSSNVIEPDAGVLAYNAATNYAIGATMDFEHHVWQALTAVVGVSPAQDTGAVKKWLDLGANNRWRMFDKRAGTKWVIGKKTTNLDHITVVIDPNQAVNSVALFGLVATSIRVRMIDPVEGVVYDETTPTSDSGGVTWYDYFFKPVKKMQTVVITDMPTYGTANVEITITNSGGTAEVNQVVIGVLETIGVTEYGTSFGTRSFSTTVEDDFGNITIISRGFKRVVEYDIAIDTWDIDRVMFMLEELRDIPAVYIGYAGMQYTITMGRYEDLSANVNNWGNTKMSLEVRSMN